MGARRQPLNLLFGGGFVLGVLVFISGIIWGFLALAVHLFGSKKEQP